MRALLASPVIVVAFAAGAVLFAVGARAQDAPVAMPMPSEPAPVASDPNAPDLLRVRAEAFGKFRAAARGKPEAVGGTSNGCLIGGVRLPASGPGFEVLHLDRHRRTGHPVLVDYIKRLALAARKAKLHPLLIGDLSQPRGGPTLTGHRSHQSGLDVDIGFTRPDWLLRRKLKKDERETLFPPAVLDLKTGQFTASYGPNVEKLIALAVADPLVDRIFVNPRIKQQLCQRPAKQRAWVRTVRPWWGHHDHLHVRLKCPAGNEGCTAQDDVPPGDGCAEIEWWLSAEAQKAAAAKAAKPPGPPKPPPPLPPACQGMIEPTTASLP